MTTRTMAPATELSVPPGGRQVLTIAAHALVERWRSLLGWGTALVAMAVLQLSVYPSVADSAESMQEFVNQWPEGFREAFSLDQYATGSGFLNAELFSLMIPLILTAIALGAASSATAGEEERGTADLLFSLPVTRWRILLGKVLAMVISVAGVASVGFVTVAVGAPVVDLQVETSGLAAASLMVSLLAVLFGALALVVGAFTGSRAAALGIGMVVALVSFLLLALGPMADWLEPWTRASAFDWALGNDPLTAGVDWPMAALLAGLSVLLIALAAIGVARRDLESR